MYNQDLDSEILKIMLYQSLIDFPGSSNGKESACNVGDLGLIPVLGRSPGEGRGNPLQYSHLENSHGPRNLAAVHWITKSQT